MRLITTLALVAIGAALATVGATSAGAGSEATGLYLHVANGARVKTAGKTCVYFVDRGVLRPVTYAAYRQLWSGWPGIELVTEIPETSVGETLRAGTRLVQVPGERAVWFIDNDRLRRWVPSFAPAEFSWNKVQKITAEELEQYQQGPDLK